MDDLFIIYCVICAFIFPKFFQRTFSLTLCLECGEREWRWKKQFEIWMGRKVKKKLFFVFISYFFSFYFLIQTKENVLLLVFFFLFIFFPSYQIYSKLIKQTNNWIYRSIFFFWIIKDIFNHNVSTYSWISFGQTLC